MLTVLKAVILATISVASTIALVASAVACDITSPTDISCGPANVNPGNPLSSLNPASPFYPANQQSAFPQNQRDPAMDPDSPYFSQPTYADGILGLFETTRASSTRPARSRPAAWVSIARRGSRARRAPRCTA